MKKFPYISQLKESNLNLSLYSYGTLKHLLLLSNGTLPNVNKKEFSSRLQHGLNVLEIVCLESLLSDFDSASWRVAREYDSKIVEDISTGVKSWESLDQSIDSTAWTYAQKMAPPKVSKVNSNQNQKGQNNTKKTLFNMEHILERLMLI